MLLPLVLGSSPHLPVSVCGTGISIQFIQAFLVSVILDTSLLLFFSLSLSVRVFPLPRLSSSPASLASFQYLYSAGISTCFPSVTPSGLSLGPDLPWADEPSPGILRLSTARILTLLLATYSSILSSTSSTNALALASPYYGMPPLPLNIFQH